MSSNDLSPSNGRDRRPSTPKASFGMKIFGPRSSPLRRPKSSPTHPPTLPLPLPPPPTLITLPLPATPLGASGAGSECSSNPHTEGGMTPPPPPLMVIKENNPRAFRGEPFLTRYLKGIDHEEAGVTQTGGLLMNPTQVGRWIGGWWVGGWVGGWTVLIFVPFVYSSAHPPTHPHSLQCMSRRRPARTRKARGFGTATRTPSTTSPSSASFSWAAGR